MVGDYMRKRCFILSINMLSLAGCGAFTPREVAEPSNVTLRQAVFDVAETLRDVRDLTPPGKKTGLMADEVTVTFNIAASSTTTNKADLTVSNVPVGNGVLGASAGTQNVSEANRGNQIVIKFRNIATADMSKGIYSLKQFQEAGGGKEGDKAKKAGDQSKMDGEQTSQQKAGTSASSEQRVSGESIQEICERTQLCVMKKKEETY